MLKFATVVGRVRGDGTRSAPLLGCAVMQSGAWLVGTSIAGLSFAQLGTTCAILGTLRHESKGVVVLLQDGAVGWLWSEEVTPC